MPMYRNDKGADRGEGGVSSVDISPKLLNVLDAALQLQGYLIVPGSGAVTVLGNRR